jgi:hypothetical protein
LDEILETHKNESQKILDECSSIASKKGITINTILLEVDSFLFMFFNSTIST